MKSTYFFITSIVLLIGCQPPQDEQVAVDEQDEKQKEAETVREKVLDLTRSVHEAGGRLDVEARTHLYSDAPDAAHMINGVRYSRDDFVERYRRLYSTLDGQTGELGEPTVTLLSRDAAVVSTQGPFEARPKVGDSFGGQFVWTLVWVRRNGQWTILHSHMSYPAPDTQYR